MLRVALCVALFIISLSYDVTAFVANIPARSEMCFVESVSRGDKVSASFAVASGGFLDIDITVTNPNGGLVYEEKRVKEGDFQFMATETGRYQVCFSNTMSTVTGKDITFNIHTGNAAMERATQGHVDPLERSVQTLKDGMLAVEDSVKYLKVRERVCRKTNQSTKSRALWWPLLENGALILMGIGQVIYVTSMFKRSR